MKLLNLVAGLFLASAVAVPAASFAQDTMGDDQGFGATVNVLVGQKMLDSDDWKGIENQMEFGVESTLGMKSWPVSVAADVLYSMGSGKNSGVKVEGSTMELAVGARRIFSFGNIHPYAGAGLAYVSGTFKAPDAGFNESETAIGFWAGGGAFYSFGKANAGLALRYSAAKADGDVIDAELGGLHAGVQLGYGF